MSQVLKIAVFDYLTLRNNPAGSCTRLIMSGLAEHYKFTLFSVQSDNPDPDRIRFIRVPAITKPLIALFISYHIAVPIIYFLFRVLGRIRFDLCQITESNVFFGDVSYVHFCHRAFLKTQWRNSGATGLRGFLRWLDHKLHALAEPYVFRRAKHVVVPSHGLARELANQYPAASHKIHVISNPVDLERHRCPEDFDRLAFRSGIGVNANDVVLTFIALGQFERKGLPLILKALPRLGGEHVKLVVVGGSRQLIDVYRQKTVAKGLTNKVIYTGMQADVRPFLWSADAFILPSSYEVFPLVALQAAAASLPLIVTQLYGVEEFLVDGKNGLLVEGTPEGVADGVERFMSMPSDQRRLLGVNACASVQPYNLEVFISAWQRFYEKVLEKN